MRCFIFFHVELSGFIEIFLHSFININVHPLDFYTFWIKVSLIICSDTMFEKFRIVPQSIIPFFFNLFLLPIYPSGFIGIFPHRFLAKVLFPNSFFRILFFLFFHLFYIFLFYIILFLEINYI